MGKLGKKTKWAIGTTIAIVVLIGILFAAGIFRVDQPTPKNYITEKYAAFAMNNKGIFLFNATTIEALSRATEKPLPSAASYFLAAEGGKVYVGFNEMDAEVWRIDFESGAVDELAIPGTVHINRLVASAPTLYCVVMDYEESSAKIVEINMTSFEITKSTLVPSAYGDPYDLAVDGESIYLAASNVTSGVSHLVKLTKQMETVASVEISVSPPTKLAVGADKIYVRGSDVVLAYTKDLVFSARTGSIFGYGSIEISGDHLYVAGYEIYGHACIYQLAAANLAIGTVKTLSENASVAFQVAIEGNVTYVGIWEAGTGASIVKIYDDTVSKTTVSDTLQNWSTDLVYYEIKKEVP